MESNLKTALKMEREIVAVYRTKEAPAACRASSMRWTSS